MKIDFATSGPEVVRTLARTGRFSRNKSSQILFEVAPGDYCHLGSKNALIAVLEQTRLVEIDEEFLRIDRGGTLWSLVNSHKFLLPRTGAPVLR